MFEYLIKADYILILSWIILVFEMVGSDFIMKNCTIYQVKSAAGFFQMLLNHQWLKIHKM